MAGHAPAIAVFGRRSPSTFAGAAAFAAPLRAPPRISLELLQDALRRSEKNRSAAENVIE